MFSIPEIMFAYLCLLVFAYLIRRAFDTANKMIIETSEFGNKFLQAYKEKDTLDIARKNSKAAALGVINAFDESFEPGCGTSMLLKRRRPSLEGDLSVVVEES
jgi:hypothetical protein